MKLLFVGDVIGKPGRQALKRLLPKLVDEHRVDYVVVNVENMAGGFGAWVKAGGWRFGPSALIPDRLRGAQSRQPVGPPQIGRQPAAYRPAAGRLSARWSAGRCWRTCRSWGR